MKKKLLVLIILAVSGIASVSADNIFISGIDTGSMIFSGNVSLYLNITDDAGNPVRGLTGDDILIYESNDGSNFSKREIKAFSAGDNERKGIRFMFLVDNSGSMYDRVDGKATDNYEKTRINAALSAITTLIQSMQGSRDRVGLSVFNTYYRELVPLNSNRNLVTESMALVEKPGKDDSFTELNASVCTAAERFGKETGRKIMIVLSDGENYPFVSVRNQDSPQFGSELFSVDDMIEALKASGTTLYAISFAGKKDPQLEQVALSTGGILFEAKSEESLKEIYNTIRKRVLDEYTVEYRSGTSHSERKYVRAELSSGSSPSGTQYFFSGNLFGKPSRGFQWVFLLALPLSAVLFFLLTRIKLSSPAGKAGLEVTDFSGATQIFDLDSQKTEIGSSENDDITVISPQGEKQNNATIVFDSAKNVYTVVSPKEVMVNNNPVKTRILEPGDVISLNGATIIFNDKEEK